MIAFSSAMLEQYPKKPDKSHPSKRLTAIINFLEEAVKVVPIESIFYTIGYGELGTAVQCARALIDANPNIPFSREASLGSQRAAWRIGYGILGNIFDMMVSDALKQQNLTSPPTTLFAQQHLSADPSAVPQSIIALRGQKYTLYSEVVQSNSAEMLVPSVTTSFPYHLYGDHTLKTYPDIAKNLFAYVERIRSSRVQQNTAVCGLSIEHVYPVNSTRRHTMRMSTLQSPIEVIRNARDTISSLLEDNTENLESSSPATEENNEKMLKIVKEIREGNMKICASLIGGFMEQQIHIPLIKSEVDTASMLSETLSPAAIGTWALFSYSFDELKDMLSRVQARSPLLLELADYLSSMSLDKDLKKTSCGSSMYATKLQFLLQGMREKTINCSSEYISYSLERQLCDNEKFQKSTSVKDLITNWDKIFERDALSLVAKSHRSLLARWLKWAILVHDLRESLAEYTCVGVTGLINSGKSLLVSKLFGIQVSDLCMWVYRQHFLSEGTKGNACGACEFFG